MSLYLHVGAIVDSETQMMLNRPSSERPYYALRFADNQFGMQFGVQFETAEDLRRLRDLIDTALNEET